jgi:hypothetical protein
MIPIQTFPWIGKQTPRPATQERVPLEPFPCPNCPAMIKTSHRGQTLLLLRLGALLMFMPIGIFSAIGGFSVIEITCLFLICLIIPTIVVTSVLLRRVNRWEVAWMRRACPSCGAVIALMDAKFCQRCGAGLPTTIVTAVISKDRVSSQQPARKTPKVKPIGTCLVCDLEMNTADLLAVCPRCSNVFHKSHLAEWVRLKKHCPVCSERLAEREIKVRSLSV